MYKLVVIALLVALAGCAEYRAVIGARGAEAADAALQDSEWMVCRASTAGALERKYALHSDPEGLKAKAWRELCYNTEGGK